MVADTRKMYELKLKIQKVLEEELLSDAFTGAVAVSKIIYYYVIEE